MTTITANDRNGWEAVIRWSLTKLPRQARHRDQFNF
jgi:hypothetical protein